MKKEKVVCSCCHVTIGHIEQAVLQGAEDFSQVQIMTGVAKSCRHCREYAENVFTDLLAESKHNKEKEPSLF